MYKYIAILRGINVGGKNKILMKNLKEALAEISLKNIVTYIQSGNIIFEYNKAEAEKSLQKKIEITIKSIFELSIPVMVFNSNYWKQVSSQNNYYNDGVPIERLHLTFLAEKPTQQLMQKLGEINLKQDIFYVNDKVVYINCENKYHQSPLTNNNIEKKLNTTATTRNFKTVLKLNELANT